MVKGLYTAYTGMLNQQNKMDVISNNLANAAVTGYKKEGSTSQSFDTVLAYKIRDRSIGVHTQRIGGMNLGVKIGENYTDYTQGPFKNTDNTYDLAISGNGFFCVQFTNKAGVTSTKYTRDGSFTVNTEGYLVTKDGDYVLNQTGAMNGDPREQNFIRLDPNAEIQVNKLGFITQNDQIVSTLGMVDIDNYDYLEKYGENLYNLLDGGNRVAADCQVEQGVLETSNVNVIKEMVNMITIQRAYEAGQKVINSVDSTLERVVSLGKV